jgi:tetratricopeptide (TPR) repeat protein
VLLTVRPMAEFYARLAEAAAAQECIDLARTSMAFLLGWYYFNVGEHGSARVHFEEAAEAAERLEQGWNQGNALVGLLCQAYHLGDYRRCLTFAAQIGASGRRRGDMGFVGAADYWDAVVKLQWGRMEEANAHLKRSAATPPAAMKPFDWMIVWGARTRLYLRQGRLELAIREADKFTRMVANAGSMGTSMAIYACAGTAATYLAAWEAAGGGAHSERVAAETACRQLDREARIYPYGRASARLYRGCCEWLAGRPRKAQRAWAEALAAAVELSFPYEEGLAHYELGRRLAEGETAEDGLGSKEHLERAAEIFERLEIPYELGLARAALEERTHS